MNPINQVVNWKFLDEPLYRWAIFMGAFAAISYGWRGALDLMK